MLNHDASGSPVKRWRMPRRVGLKADSGFPPNPPASLID
ncbi:hypothetical protein RISK_004198 [Rhodopirellula islandica]|uniref:Uncharacterized protein n=1 Tax=Rhodopirellula islandica TaxID=595434 RepID=A0A0J1BB80_RHOIS|nr:hypothetical protein RISK_004198 [Rhodopirellula islandica]